MPSVGVITYDVTPLQGALANAFLVLIHALFFNVKFIGNLNQYPEDSSLKLLKDDEKVFDFIIVGAGAAGCALANRLSEQDQWSVLLIEAGNYPQPTSGVPAFFPTFLDTLADMWHFTFDKDKRVCQAYQNRQCRTFRGKLIGGTSAINNMHYFRGLDEVGNNTEMIYENIEYHSNNYAYPGGQLHLEKVLVNDTIAQALMNAYHKQKVYYNSDKSAIGHTHSYLMLKDGERYHAARAFLTPLKSRSNFFLSKDTLVEGVVLNDPMDKRAKGVNVTINNRRLFLQARKELILTAGPINNAKLLLLSGLGPRDYLEKRKIPVVLNMPGVGKNLNFHLGVPLFFALNSSIFYEEYTQADMLQDTFDYVMYRKGNLSTTGLNSLVTFLSTEFYPNIPNIGVHHNYFKVGDRMLKVWLEGLNFNSNIISNILKVAEKQVVLMFIVILLRTKSLGEIRLNDTHFQGNPHVVGNFFTDPDGEDLLALTSAVSKVTNLLDTPTFQELGIELMDIGVPDCRNYKFCTAHYVKCYIHNMVYPTSAMAGSLKRGPECDNNAVVKTDFEVRYIRCLRVCDSSILQHAGLSNTIAIDSMMAVKLSEILKEKWIRDYVSPYT